MTKHDRGFTLVELLVSIGIIAILVTLLLPVVRAARRHADMAVCSSNLRQMTIAALMHAQDHRGYLPLAGELVIPSVSDFNRDAYPSALGDPYRRRYTYASKPWSKAFAIVPIPGSLAPYMGVTDLPYNNWALLDQALNEQRFWRRFQCPATDSYAKARASTSLSDTTLVGQAIMVSFKTPGDLIKMPWSTNSDYGMNEGALGYHFDPRYDSRRLRGRLLNRSHVDQLVLFTDARPRATVAYPYLHPDPWICWTPSLKSKGPVTLADAWKNNGKAADKHMFDTVRHRERINVAFADGHVQTMRINTDELEQAYLLLQ